MLTGEVNLEELQLKKMPSINGSSITLTELEYDLFMVSINLPNTSARQRITAIIQGHLKRFRPTIINDITYAARRYSRKYKIKISPGRMFILAAAERPATEDGYSQEQIEWALAQEDLPLDFATALGIEVSSVTGTEMDKNENT